MPATLKGPLADSANPRKLSNVSPTLGLLDGLPRLLEVTQIESEVLGAMVTVPKARVGAPIGRGVSGTLVMMGATMRMPCEIPLIGLETSCANFEGTAGLAGA